MNKKVRKQEYTDSLGRKWKWDSGRQKYVYQRKDPSSAPRAERPTTLEIREEDIGNSDVKMVMELLGKGYIIKKSPAEISIVKMSKDKSKVKILYMNESLFSMLPPKKIIRMGGLGTVSSPAIYKGA